MSQSLIYPRRKFTPPGGTVAVRIKCVGELEMEEKPASSHRGPGPKSHTSSRNPLSRSSRLRSKGSNDGSSIGSNTSSSVATPKKGVEVNSRDSKLLPAVHVRERSLSPPPLNTRTLLFEFEVEDTGPGIPATQQQKVFEPFVQGDLGLSKKYGGTGLGLSICSQLAHLMKGSITLHSEEGQGSTFNMRIPIKLV